MSIYYNYAPYGYKLVVLYYIDDCVYWHRWELPVGNYPDNSGNYHYPFFWVIFMVILHDFIFKNYHENQSDCYPFFRNGKLPDFFYKLPYYNFSDVLSKFIFALRICKKMHRFFFQRVLE